MPQLFHAVFCSSALPTYLHPLVLKFFHCPTNPLLKSLFTLVMVTNNSSFILWATVTMELLSGMRPMRGPTISMPRRRVGLERGTEGTAEILKETVMK